MPLYEYECQECATRFERIQRFSDPPVSECPECGGGVRKLLSAPAIQFKGDGWYITDYARKGDGQAKESKAKEKEDGASGGESKSAGKSEEKSGKSAEAGQKSGERKPAASASSQSDTSKN